MKVKEAFVGTGLVAALAVGGVLATAGPAQALPRSCVQLVLDYEMELGNMNESWQEYNDWHRQIDLDNYYYWQSRADTTSALMATC